MKSLVHLFLFSKWGEDILIKSLRVSIAFIFIWFGLLKIFGHNPVLELVEYSVMPFLGAGKGLFFLGVLEVVIGVLLLANKYLTFTYTVIILHLIGTFSTFIFGWHVVFQPYFPVLSLGGEFVVKNVTLIISALVVLVHEERKLQSDN